MILMTEAMMMRETKMGREMRTEKEEEQWRRILGAGECPRLETRWRGVENDTA